MRKSITVALESPEHFKKKLISYVSNYQIFSILDRNTFNQNPNLVLEYDFIAAIEKIAEIKNVANNNFGALQQEFNKLNDWLFGYFSYDLKNETEPLTSSNFDGIKAPKMHFFQPQFVILIKEKKLVVEYLPQFNTENEAINLIKLIKKYTLCEENNLPEVKIKQRVSKNKYIEAVNKLKEHISVGDIYEINYCMEFFATKITIATDILYNKICKISPTPFSCFYRNDEIFAISASPERFLIKIGTKIISQPIKGTIKRGKTPEEDALLSQLLENDIKERAENIMIVDLVRNDLSKTASFGSVKVDELCKIYSFAQVHQMISSISCTLDSEKDGIATLKNCFPMGSMTGAPKIKAMQLIEQYEFTKRGIYSGSIGYIKPNGDFDFNVIIRTILYNSAEKYLSFMVGSAITHLSIAENEYNECLLKAEAMFKAII